MVVYQTVMYHPSKYNQNIPHCWWNSNSLNNIFNYIVCKYIGMSKFASEILQRLKLQAHRAEAGIQWGRRYWSRCGKWYVHILAGHQGKGSKANETNCRCPRCHIQNGMSWIKLKSPRLVLVQWRIYMVGEQSAGKNVRITLGCWTCLFSLKQMPWSGLVFQIT